MIRKIFILLLLCIGNGIAYSQTEIFRGLDKEQYIARVKTLDEFMSRFNGNEKRNDVPVEYSDRESNILLLFDLSKFKSKQDSNFIKIKEFAKCVADNRIAIEYADTSWYARVKCNGKLANKPVEFYMSLVVEEKDSDIYRWAIRDVNGDIFKNSRDHKHRELFLFPNEHEQFFQAIRKTTTETYKFIDDYVIKQYQADELSTFLALVRSDQLKIETITDVKYVFRQVPGYIFSVKYFERNGKNVGWLIDSCEKSSEVRGKQ